MGLIHVVRARSGPNPPWGPCLKGLSGVLQAPTGLSVLLSDLMIQTMSLAAAD